MNIRDAAINCEVRKIAYRQTKDGVVVSFVLHPNDVPPSLANAHLGTRYMLAFVEIGDDEQPKGGAADGRPVNNETPRQETKTGGARKWGELPYPQQAALACNDPVFRAYLNEAFGYQATSTDEAAEAIRDLCGVGSRAALQPGTHAGAKWAETWINYGAWQIMDRAS